MLLNRSHYYYYYYYYYYTDEGVISVNDVDCDDSGNHVNVKNNVELKSFHLSCRFSGCFWSD